jgi:hypothetical protein
MIDLTTALEELEPVTVEDLLFKGSVRAD